jgi:hypothetical protein
MKYGEEAEKKRLNLRFLFCFPHYERKPPVSSNVYTHTH